jgi:hypothetical protein
MVAFRPIAVAVVASLAACAGSVSPTLDDGQGGGRGGDPEQGVAVVDSADGGAWAIQDGGGGAWINQDGGVLVPTDGASGTQAKDGSAVQRPDAATATDSASAPDTAVTLTTNAVVRANKPSTGEHFYTLSAAEATGAGFTIEADPYYFLATSAGPAGFVPFYRCYLPSVAKHFYTTSASCEGSGGTNEGALGDIASSTSCGATALYRLNKPAVNDHFYTIDPAERDLAVASFGYTYEGVAGFVWTSGTIVCP